jgi:CBS domain-containing protein
MTPSPHAVAPDDTIASALHSMAVGGYRHVPVVREGRPVAFVSIRGILGYLAKNAL